MKTEIYSTNGTKASEIELPEIFSEAYRPDLIKKAFLAELSNKIQPKGSDPLAGMRRIAESWDVGGGRSRIPRAKAGPHRGARARGHRFRSKGRWFPAAGRALVVPGTVGGRQAHPPKAEKILSEKINKKELHKALRSAIAATANKNLVQAHGHLINEIKGIPIIVEDTICDLKKTKEAEKTLLTLGFKKELSRAANYSQRAGQGKLRGRRYKKKTSALIVVPQAKRETYKKFSNIPGVETATAAQLNISLLAPGAKAGRLTVWTKSSLKEVESRFCDTKK